jgi:PIN domain nuclease of toxin-antitoxin system
VRLLLDAHAFLWAVNDSPQLSDAARALIENRENDLLLSVASLWEVAIKLSTGKLKLELPFLELATQKTAQHGVTLLSIAPGHLDLVATLPFHHRDPFDRLLAAQCLAEGVPLLSRDGALDAYGLTRLW